MQNAGKRKKGKNLKTILLLCLIGIITTNCNKDEPVILSVEESAFDIGQAQSWFQSNYNATIIFNNDKGIAYKKDNSGKRVVLRPDWNMAFTSTRGNLQTVEVGMQVQGQFRQVRPSAYNKWKETDNLNYTVSMLRLVFLKEKHTDNIRTFIMSVIPEADYLESKNFKLWKNTYFSKDKNFSGNIMFYSPIGKYINGWKLDDGKVSASIEQVPDIPMTNGVQILGECVYETTYQMYVQETEWWTLGDDGEPLYYQGSTYTYFNEVEHIELYCSTTEEDPEVDDSYSGGSSGGGSGESAWDDRVSVNLPPKADCIYQFLKKSGYTGHNIISEIFANFGSSSLYGEDLIYKASPGLVNENGQTLAGRTYLSSSGNYVVELNTDLIGSRSSIEVANTILHESMHAILLVRSGNSSATFNEIYGDYIANQTGEQTLHHAIIEAEYIPMMTDALKQFDGGPFSDSFYKNLAWEGVKNFATSQELANLQSAKLTARQNSHDCDN